MAIPTYEEFMFPILQFLADTQEHSKKEIVMEMVNFFNLTQTQLNDVLSHGEPRYKNRIGWALTYLKKAGLIENTKRAHFKITDDGIDIVDRKVSNLNASYLQRYASFLEFLGGSYNKKNDNVDAFLKEPATPLENIISSFEIIKKNVCDELLAKIFEQSSDFFEQIVIDLVVAMGYGGSTEDAGQATKRTKDEGIDGIIKEDKLGLGVVYLQAKRWQKGSIVGRPEIQKFVGALAGQGAKKGIFITTSSFSQEALNYRPRNDTSIVLIDGQKLVDLMYEYNIGISIEKKFEVKKIDGDYFE